MFSSDSRILLTAPPTVQRTAKFCDFPAKPTADHAVCVCATSLNECAGKNDYSPFPAQSFLPNRFEKPHVGQLSLRGKTGKHLVVSGSVILGVPKRDF